MATNPGCLRKEHRHDVFEPSVFRFLFPRDRELCVLHPNAGVGVRDRSDANVHRRLSEGHHVAEGDQASDATIGQDDHDRVVGVDERHAA